MFKGAFFNKLTKIDPGVVKKFKKNKICRLIRKGMFRGSFEPKIKPSKNCTG
jgi:hypothetical protein